MTTTSTPPAPVSETWPFALKRAFPMASLRLKPPEAAKSDAAAWVADMQVHYRSGRFPSKAEIIAAIRRQARIGKNSQATPENLCFWIDDVRRESAAQHGNVNGDGCGLCYGGGLIDTEDGATVPCTCPAGEHAITHKLPWRECSMEQNRSLRPVRERAVTAANTQRGGDGG